MICEAKISELFRGMDVPSELVSEIVGKPVNFGYSVAGKVIDVNTFTGMIRMEIDDRFKSDATMCGMSIIRTINFN